MVNTQSENEAFFDGDIAPRVERVIREAREYVVLVSPFVRSWRHVEDEIEQTTRRNVPVTIIVRPEALQTSAGGWLQTTTAWVYPLEGLHAKIYLNEKSLLVSSMNLYQYSSQNSYEFGLLIREPRLSAEIRKYVNEVLVPRTGLERLPTAPPTVEQMGRGSSQPAPSITYSVNEPRAKYAPTALGHCIRCDRPIPPTRRSPSVTPAMNRGPNMKTKITKRTTAMPAANQPTPATPAPSAALVIRGSTGSPCSTPA